MDRLEAALGGRKTPDSPRSDGFVDTFKLVQAKVAETEEIAEQATGKLGDYYGIRVDQRLHASCNVGGVPDHSMLPKFPLATAVADYHYTGGDANPHGEGFSSTSFEPRNSGDDIKPCSYRSLSIVLVCAGIAEIGQYPVSPEIGKETVVGKSDTGASGMIGINNGAHVFRIKARRQGCRTDKIADHHSEVTAFSTLRVCAFPQYPPGIARGRAGDQRADRSHKALPVAQRNPHLFEIGFCQFLQYVPVDRVATNAVSCRPNPRFLSQLPISMVAS